MQQFQKGFVSTVTRLFSALPLDVRLASLALAVKAVTDESRYVRVTLADYLQTTTTTDERSTLLPSDFLEQCAAGNTEFVACVPDALFTGITHARNDKVHSIVLKLTNNNHLTLFMSTLGDIYSFASWQNRHFGGVFRP